MPARPLTLRDVLVAKIGQLVLRAEINNVCGTNQSMVVLSYLVISYSTPNVGLLCSKRCQFKYFSSKSLHEKCSLLENTNIIRIKIKQPWHIVITYIYI